MGQRKRFSRLLPENGSCQGQNLAATVLFVPNWGAGVAAPCQTDSPSLARAATFAPPRYSPDIFRDRVRDRDRDSQAEKETDTATAARGEDRGQGVPLPSEDEQLEVVSRLLPQS